MFLHLIFTPTHLVFAYNLYIYMYIYIYIYIYVYVIMKAQCALPVITPTALRQLMHLAT